MKNMKNMKNMKIKKEGVIVNLTESDIKKIVDRVLIHEAEESEFKSMLDDEKTNSHISVDSRGKAKKICEKCIKPLLDSGRVELSDIPNCNFCNKGKIQKHQAWRCAVDTEKALPGSYGTGLCVLKNARNKWKKIG